jgi:hypothetical protein
MDGHLKDVALYQERTAYSAGKVVSKPCGRKQGVVGETVTDTCLFHFVEIQF